MILYINLYDYGRSIYANTSTDACTTAISPPANSKHYHTQVQDFDEKCRYWMRSIGADGYRRIVDSILQSHE